MMADAGEPEHQTRGLANVRAARPGGAGNTVSFDGCQRALEDDCGVSSSIVEHVGAVKVSRAE
jgi:hypothetical protein